LSTNKNIHSYILFPFPKFRAGRHLGKDGMGLLLERLNQHGLKQPLDASTGSAQRLPPRLASLKRRVPRPSRSIPEGDRPSMSRQARQPPAPPRPSKIPVAKRRGQTLLILRRVMPSQSKWLLTNLRLQKE